LDNIDEILIISLSGTLFGIDTREVRYILKIMPITLIPFSPPEVLGFCAIEGNINTVLDLSLLIKDKKINTNEPKVRTLLIETKSLNTSFCLIVSSVSNNIEIEQDRIEYIDNSSSNTIAIYKLNETIIQIISIEKLLNNIELPIKEISNITIKNNEHDQFLKRISKESTKRFLLFKMEDEIFALSVERVREVINIPQEFTNLAETSAEIYGMFSLRDELILALDLRVHYDFKASLSTKNRIIIAQSRTKYVGLIVDELINIIDIKTKNIKEMPEHFKNQKLDGVTEFKHNLISIIKESEIDKIVKDNFHIIDQSNTRMALEIIKDIHIEFEIVIFSLGMEEYAFDIEAVSEIIELKHSEITKISNVSSFIKGLMNIRGKVVPIISLHDLINIEYISSSEEEEKQVIVCIINGHLVGFIVDKVSDVRKVLSNEIKDEESEEYFSEVIQLDNTNRIILLFDIEYLFSDEVEYIIEIKEKEKIKVTPDMTRNLKEIRKKIV
jgi:purine-binding chemotaxis protein CheW